MNISTYDLYHRSEVLLSEVSQFKHDVFISCYNTSERVQSVFNASDAITKIWLIQPEYGIDLAESDSYLKYANDIICDEASFIMGFWEQHGQILKDKNICIDITGFIRPNLLFLMYYLNIKGIKKFDLIYSEPVAYQYGENTDFASKTIHDIRPVEGYCGSHNVDTSQDILIVGAGYDNHLTSKVAEEKNRSSKYQLFGFPSLRADMFQENLLKAAYTEESLGSIYQGSSNTLFAPAYDPFETASEISKLVSRELDNNSLSNLYLSPLSSKPQTLGFALYYIFEGINLPATVIFPFCKTYNQETSIGVSRIWRYGIELPAD